MLVSLVQNVKHTKLCFHTC